jgi:hypothetical protein
VRASGRVRSLPSYCLQRDLDLDSRDFHEAWPPTHSNLRRLDRTARRPVFIRTTTAPSSTPSWPSCPGAASGRQHAAPEQTPSRNVALALAPLPHLLDLRVARPSTGKWKSHAEPACRPVGAAGPPCTSGAAPDAPAARRRLPTPHRWPSTRSSIRPRVFPATTRFQPQITAHAWTRRRSLPASGRPRKPALTCENAGGRRAWDSNP